jgi:cell division topological specificity factor
MSLFDWFKKNKSSKVAKERLMMVLSYERKGLPPNFANRLKEDLIKVFERYPQFDASKIDVDLRKSENNADLEELWISIPFAKKGREHAEG